MDKVAIVLPFKNAEKFIRKTLDAIHDQSHKNWELIAVDDGSTDLSVSTVISVMCNKKFSLLTSAAGNPAGTRNVALSYILHRDFNYVAYCDADDVWDVDHLSIAINKIRETGASMVYSDTRTKLEDGSDAQMFGIPYYPEFLRSNLVKGNFIFISTVVHSKECLSVGEFDSTAVPMEDWDYWLRISDKYKVVHNTMTTCAYLYKDKSGSYYTSDQSVSAKDRIIKKISVHKNPREIDGWLSEIEGEFLSKTADGKVCLELGSYKGKSSCYMARNAVSLHCVDTFRADGGGQTQQLDFSTLKEFIANVTPYGNVTPIISDSAKAASTFGDGQFDVIFVDAMHDYVSVSRDAEVYWPKLKIGGQMLFHDYNEKDWPGVVMAITEKFGVPDEVVDTIAKVTKKSENFSKKETSKSYVGKRVMIAPFSNKLTTGENPKNFPHWIELVSLMRAFGIYTIQVGVTGEPLIGADEMAFNLTNDTLKKYIETTDTFISVDSFFQHFSAYYGKKGVVIFSQSDPNIFGHPLHVNVLKSRACLRPNQFNLWTQAEFNKDAFPSTKQVFEELLKLLDSK